MSLSLSWFRREGTGKVKEKHLGKELAERRKGAPSKVFFYASQVLSKGLWEIRFLALSFPDFLLYFFPASSCSFKFLETVIS